MNEHHTRLAKRHRTPALTRRGARTCQREKAPPENPNGAVIGKLFQAAIGRASKKARR